MYDELVKRLKNCATQAAPCLTCDMTDDGSCIETLMKQAADAIEVVSKTEKTTQWIPVSERLPEKANDYLVHVKCGCDGEFIGAWEQVAWFCEKFYWEHLHGDDIFEETVTHWMPLPEPPKEE